MADVAAKDGSQVSSYTIECVCYTLLSLSGDSREPCWSPGGIGPHSSRCWLDGVCFHQFNLYNVIYDHCHISH